jgi:hypothetical protein
VGVPLAIAFGKSLLTGATAAGVVAAAPDNADIIRC